MREERKCTCNFILHLLLHSVSFIPLFSLFSLWTRAWFSSCLFSITCISRRALLVLASCIAASSSFLSSRLLSLLFPPSSVEWVSLLILSIEEWGVDSCFAFTHYFPEFFDGEERFSWCLLRESLSSSQTRIHVTSIVRKGNVRTLMPFPLLFWFIPFSRPDPGFIFRSLTRERDACCFCPDNELQREQKYDEEEEKRVKGPPPLPSFVYETSFSLRLFFLLSYPWPLQLLYLLFGCLVSPDSTETTRETAGEWMTRARNARETDREGLEIKMGRDLRVLHSLLKNCYPFPDVFNVVKEAGCKERESSSPPHPWLWNFYFLLLLRLKKTDPEEKKSERGSRFIVICSPRAELLFSTTFFTFSLTRVVKGKGEMNKREEEGRRRERYIEETEENQRNVEENATDGNLFSLCKQRTRDTSCLIPEKKVRFRSRWRSVLNTSSVTFVSWKYSSWRVKRKGNLHELSCNSRYPRRESVVGLLCFCFCFSWEVCLISHLLSSPLILMPCFMPLSVATADAQVFLSLTSSQ